MIDDLDSFYCHTIPDCSNPRAIASYTLQRLDVIIAAYQAP